jgi:hypothetical protein
MKVYITEHEYFVALGNHETWSGLHVFKTYCKAEKSLVSDGYKCLGIRKVFDRYQINSKGERIEEWIDVKVYENDIKNEQAYIREVTLY